MKLVVLLLLALVAHAVPARPVAAQSAAAGAQSECVPDGHTWALGGAPAPPTSPRPLQVFGIQQCDPQQLGRPTLTVIDCSFATDHDRVYVYDQSGQMPRTTRWEEAVNFHDSVWLFDVGSTGTLSLVIQFQRGGADHDTAVLYDAPATGSSTVQVTNGYLNVSPPNWTAYVETTGPDSVWLLPDGRLNQNIHAFVDAPLDSGHFPPDIVAQLSAKGQPKWEVGIVDSDHTGIPDYAYTLLLPNDAIPYDSAVPRAGLQVNSGRHPTQQPTGYVFWPLLGGSYQGGNYFDTPYHISYDWSARRFVGIGLDGYPIEDGYHINTLRYFFRDPNRVNYADFENPMSYYDLWGNHDGRPELFVRMAYYGEDDIYLTGQSLPTPLEEINYSWNQFHESGLYWSYRLGLLGRNPVDTTVQIGDLRVGTVPHDQLPGWVTTRPWDIATFVADEGGSYQSAEGIYEWAPLEGVYPDATNGLSVVPGEKEAAQRYVLGTSRVSPAPYFNAIRPGFRGEYGEPNSQVRLYFSPIDHRLHLLTAQFGVWNLGGTRELRYGNLGGSYIDHWQLLEGGVERSSLWNVGGQLVLADQAGVHLHAGPDQEASFTTGPPTDQNGWQQLGTALQAGYVPFNGDDLAAMLAQFGGPTTDLPGARLSDVHLTTDGFRFVCQLPASAVGAAPWTVGLAPGSYVVTFDRQRGYQAEPAGPPELAMTLQPDHAVVVAGEPVSLAVDLTNGGGVDAYGLQIAVDASLNGQSVNLGTATADVLAGMPSTAALIPWSPTSAGQWVVHARAVLPSGETAAEADLPLAVALPEPGVRAADMTLGGQFGLQPSTALLLGLAIGAVLLTLAVSPTRPAVAAGDGRDGNHRWASVRRTLSGRFAVGRARAARALARLGATRRR
jgi:hypothetical protein